TGSIPAATDSRSAELSTVTLAAPPWPGCWVVLRSPARPGRPQRRSASSQDPGPTVLGVNYLIGAEATRLLESRSLGGQPHAQLVPVDRIHAVVSGTDKALCGARLVKVWNEPWGPRSWVEN